MKTVILFCLAALFSASVSAQSATTCDSKYHAGFDFWLGSWTVTDTLGDKQGENVIQRIEQGCLVTERWTGASGGTGRSMNYFDASDSTWNQLWVSNNGFILKLKGYSSENQMTLMSEPTINQQGDEVAHRITWTLNKDATVTQLWEILNEENQVTVEAFRGIYTKRKGN